MDGPTSWGEWLTALSLIGAVMFHPVIIGIFDAGPETTILGIPLLFLYLFGGWAGLILMMGIAVEWRRRRGERRPQSSGNGG